MHILLTDVLTCPRCGPELGLIVLADRMDERRVVEGRLGCANCREEYPVHGAIADLRVARMAPDPNDPDATPLERTPPEDPTLSVDESDPEERAYRLAALLAIGHGGGVALLAGGAPDLVHRVAELLPNAQVIGASAREPSRSAGAGWILHSAGLPFRDRSLRGVALLDGISSAGITEAARVLAPGAHLVLDPASPDMVQVVATHRLMVLLDQDGVMVASAPARG